MSRIVLKNALVIDGVGGRLDDANIVIDGSRIEQVSTLAVPERPSDRVVDLTGRTVIPGLFNCHFHAQSRFLDTRRRGEIYVGSERPAGVMMAVAIETCRMMISCGYTGYAGAGCSDDIDVQLRMCIEEGIIPGPRIFASSNYLATTGHYGDNAKWWFNMENCGYYTFVDGPDEFRRAVRTQIRRGADVIKLIATGGPAFNEPRDVRGFTRDELHAVVEAAHERGAKVRVHSAWRDSIVECIEAGVDVIDHGDEVDEELIAMMAERGTYWVPSMMFLKALKLAENEESQAYARSAGDLDKHWDNLCHMVSLANDAGVNVVPGDDYGNSFMPHAPGMYARELEIYVDECGVPAQDVLRWATSTSAKLCNLEGKAGLVQSEAFADLVILASDPTADIRVLQDPSAVLGVLKDGTFVKDLAA